MVPLCQLARARDRIRSDPSEPRGTPVELLADWLAGWGTQELSGMAILDLELKVHIV